jgi:hypothetical protein
MLGADKNDTSELIKARTQDAQQNQMSNKKKKSKLKSKEN